MTYPSSWTDKFSWKDSMLIIKRLSMAHAQKSGEYSEAICSAIAADNFEYLLDFPFDYGKLSTEEGLNLRQSLGLFQKWRPLNKVLKRDLEGIAFSKFLASEVSCRSVNEKLRPGRFSKPIDMDLDTLERLSFMRRKIKTILGRCPSLPELDFRLGPGASTARKRYEAVPSYKLAPPYTCSPHSVPYLESVLSQMPQLLREFGEVGSDEVWRVPVEVTDARLEFVPKDCKSFRSIAVEPGLTSIVQLGIGAHMSLRLKRFGIDLEKGQQTNRDLAKRASLSGSHATIDLSSASDSVSYELVRYLLPTSWFELLNGFRSPAVSYRGTRLLLEKFSSMGNGFTFPLESLIFYAACLAVKPVGSVAVYGDDIIIDSQAAPELIKLLSSIGFKTNEEKSFLSGPFRESCGGDYLRGINIRPYRFKKDITPMSLFSLHNHYVRTGQIDMSEIVLGFIHPSLRIFGPDGYGDGHLLGDWQPLAHKRDRGWGGFTFETFSLRSPRSVRRLPGDYIALLYSTYISGGASENQITQEGKLIKSFPRAESDRRYNRIRIYTFTR